MDDTVREILKSWYIDQKWLNMAVAKTLKEQRRAAGCYGCKIDYQCDNAGITIHTENGDVRYTWLKFGKMAQEYINGK